jgi:hypothetical protein
MATVTLTLKLLHQSVLTCLDVLIAGPGVFHACGRIACLLAGCCYGRGAYQNGVLRASVATSGITPVCRDPQSIENEAGALVTSVA